MKTDLSKILSISGQSGLFRYVSQSRAGAIVESLADMKRTCFGMNSRITTLADISIYTEDGELKLKDVFLKMKEVLGEDDAPAAKSAPEQLKSFFGQAVPEYDRDRFYVSHMKKVVEWYNALKKYASLDFTDADAEAAAEGAGESDGGENGAGQETGKEE
ncbi:MAG: DUF5606 domain-containing protein [Bacteroidetes bacterium]|uniref:DUF5606 domain-containing protein n=1 Tax=Candidatus Cryptobacteroides merdavium TaxID=2840769 RepID=A0A9D9EF39_9BACT|nr:DUF5606 domain-containing protein [Candidatus Cryptobacteroides merdavium]